MRRFAVCDNPEAKAKRRTFKALEVRKDSFDEKNIIDIASEDYFFEREFEGIEESLKVKENRYGRLIDVLESESKVHLSQNHLISELALNLSFRTESSRVNMALLLSEVMAWARTQIAADKSFVKQVENETLDKLFYRSNFGYSREMLARARFKMKNSREFKTQIQEAIEMLPIFSAMVEEKFKLMAPEISKRTQCQIITEKDFSNNTLWSKLEWTLFEVDSPIILSDVGVFAYSKDSDEYLPLMWALFNKKINHIVLPINKNTVLCGLNRASDLKLIKLKIKPNEINKSSAKLSHDFFVTDSVDLAIDYQGLIGDQNVNYGRKWTNELIDSYSN